MEILNAKFLFESWWIQNVIPFINIATDHSRGLVDILFFMWYYLSDFSLSNEWRIILCFSFFFTISYSFVFQFFFHFTFDQHKNNTICFLFLFLETKCNKITILIDSYQSIPQSSLLPLLFLHRPSYSHSHLPVSLWCLLIFKMLDLKWCNVNFGTVLNYLQGIDNSLANSSIWLLLYGSSNTTFCSKNQNQIYVVTYCHLPF